LIRHKSSTLKSFDLSIAGVAVMDRRKFLISSTTSSVLTALGLTSIVACGSGGTGGTDTDIEPDTGDDNEPEEVSLTTLIIPPLIEDTGAGISLTAQSGATEFFEGVPSDTWGFNGNYLGPTIRVRRGDSVDISIENTVDEAITSHWHGLHIPGDVDGGPYQMVESNTTWSPTLEIAQQASTNWYHSHVHGNTGRQVYMGLAGLFLIDDDDSDALNLPNDYGVDDIPVIIQDKLFDDDGNLDYSVDNIPGGRFAGNTMLVNGKVEPVMEVEAKRIRFRLLNASNARFYNFTLSDGSSFYKIGTEGGLLNEPIEISSLYMTPGERNEIIIDLTGYAAGTQLAIQSSNEEAQDENLPGDFDVLTIAVKELDSDNPTLPTLMNSVPDVSELLASVTVTANRLFDLAAGQINDQVFSMARIDHATNQGDYEIWDIRGGNHPFHMHGCSFLILSDDGALPAAEESGWKDTVLARGGTQGVTVLVQFNYLAPATSAYMYHCHILGHEDTGMMGQFTVV